MLYQDLVFVTLNEIKINFIYQFRNTRPKVIIHNNSNIELRSIKMMTFIMVS